MKLERSIIYGSILKVAEEMDSLHNKVIAVSTPSVLVPRDQILHVYQEGELFGGSESIGLVEACLAPIPAPHVASSIPKETFMQLASEIFGKQAKLLPKYDNVDFFPPQLIVWWKMKNKEEAYDFSKIYTLPHQEIKDFCSIISKKTEQAVRLIARLKGRPIIWGTWGHGLPEERVVEGLTRGAPTLKEGHLHITYFDQDEQEVKFEVLNYKDKLNHYIPWNKIILRRFGKDLGEVISSVFASACVPREIHIEVKRENDAKRHPNNTISIHDGYCVNFSTPIAMESVLCILITLAGKFEESYGQIHNLFAEYMKTSDDIVKSQIVENIAGVIKELGFSEKSAQEFTSFILSIRPTYGQLLLWRDEIIKEGADPSQLIQIDTKISRYEAFKKRWRKRQHKPSTLPIAIMEDAFRDPNSSDITFTWPVHASACYMIKDYEVVDNNIYIKSLYLYPNFLTTESAVEKELGVVLKRPTTAASLKPIYERTSSIGT